MKYANPKDIFQVLHRLSTQATRPITRALAHLTSSIFYRTSLRTKLLVPVLLVALSVLAVLGWFSFLNIQHTIAAIYEQKAVTVSAVISKSIQQQQYILYYSEQLDEDIDSLLEKYESLMGITVMGMTARGLRVVASTDPTVAGNVISADRQEYLSSLRDVDVSRVDIGSRSVLRAYQPLFREAEFIGVLSLDMSLQEQNKYLGTLLFQLGLGSLTGFLVLGALIYLILRSSVTKRVTLLARAARAVSQRNYDVEVSTGPTRAPGTPIRDEISSFIRTFNLMVRVLSSREKELREMVALDELTGVYNLPHFRKILSEELEKGDRYDHPTSLLQVEVVGADQLQGTEKNNLLIATANFLVENVRAVDPIFRIREYSFAILLPQTPLEGANTASVRIRSRMPDLVTEYADYDLSLELSPTGSDAQQPLSLQDILGQLQLESSERNLMDEQD